MLQLPLLINSQNSVFEESKDHFSLELQKLPLQSCCEFKRRKKFLEVFEGYFSQLKLIRRAKKKKNLSCGTTFRT